MSLTREQLAALMRDIDTCLVTTLSADGLQARPMSNNKDVSWDGTSWFFALEDTGLVRQVRADARVLVTCTGAHGVWIAVTGTAEVHEDRELLATHWDPDIERWYADGVDTPGLRLVQVRGEQVRYWTFADGDGVLAL